VIRERHDAEAETAELEHHRGACRDVVAARAHVPDPGRLEASQGVEQGLDAEVQGVVVREGHAADAEIDERLHGAGWSPEEERLLRIGPRFASIRDAAFEVEDEQIGLATGGRDHRRDERLRRLDREPVGDHAAEHRVAGECDPHASHLGVHRHRTNRKNDRISSTNRSGCSNAAKCPPRAGSFQ
jgi:hypothetical protein